MKRSSLTHLDAEESPYRRIRRRVSSEPRLYLIPARLLPIMLIGMLGLTGAD